jgi:V8-like Glu-specific endopeptidase
MHQGANGRPGEDATMSEHAHAPQSMAELLEVDDKPIARDARPWGEVTPSSLACWAEGGTGVELERSRLHPQAYLLRSSGAVHFGLPVMESRASHVHSRTMADRLANAQRRRFDQADREHRRSSVLGEPHCPEGVPRGIHPKLIGRLSAERFGINSRGTKTLLSEDPHSTIINGESRIFLYPDQYPHTAVCKLYISYQAVAGGPWKQTGEATGFLIGKSTLMTSGHVQPPPGNAWMIRVVPACWAGQSVFGAGFMTYVRETVWWDSDSGSDIQICHLYDPIGERTGYFGYRGYDSDWEDGAYWCMAGFPYDRSLTSMSYESGIAVRDDDDGDDIDVDGERYDTTQVESDADEASGASGSPLWGYWSGMPYAIGVHHGVERDGTVFGTEILSCASGGDGFTAAAHWGRGMWG